MDYKPEEFVLPEFHTVEVALPARPGAPGTFAEAEFDRDDLELDHEMLLERVVLTENSFQQSLAAPVNTSILPLIRTRWWEDKDRAYGDFLPLNAIDERRPDLSVVDAPAAGGAGYGQLVYEPKGPEPLYVRDKDGIVVDWENPNAPAGGVGFAGGQVDVAVSGELIPEQRPYSLYVPVAFAAGAVDPAGLIAGSTSPGQTSRNRTGQDMLVKRVVITINTTDYATLATDARIWRQLRLMVRLSGKERDRWASYSERAPLVAFGERVTVNNHSVTIPFAAKKYMPAKYSMQFAFRNYSTIATRMIATFCGLKKLPRLGTG